MESLPVPGLHSYWHGIQ